MKNKTTEEKIRGAIRAEDRRIALAEEDNDQWAVDNSKNHIEYLKDRLQEILIRKSRQQKL